MGEAGLAPAIERLAQLCGATWPTITRSAIAALKQRSALAADVTQAGLVPVPVDTSIIVFGSLARGEWTRGSDLDWAFLVDGQVDVEHAAIAHQIAEVVAGEGRQPGPTGVFGGLTFGHDLVHFIGGDDDSNTNTTRRILLLLESRSLIDDRVRVRVLRALLSRYVGEDLLYHAPERFLVPRFLLNDYVRYWRTMTVDSAQKRRDRMTKWALRNIKLRLSRKLIFATGLWACLSCRLHPSAELKQAREKNDRPGVATEMASFLLEFSQRTPLENLAEAYSFYGAGEGAKLAFDAYEAFLRLLDEADQRERLEKLRVEQALSDAVFRQAKDIAAQFQSGLTKLRYRPRPDNRCTDLWGILKCDQSVSRREPWRWETFAERWRCWLEWAPNPSSCRRFVSTSWDHS